MKHHVLDGVLELLSAKCKEYKQSLGILNMEQYVERATSELVRAYNSFGYNSYRTNGFGETFEHTHHFKYGSLRFVFDIDKAISLLEGKPNRFDISEFDVSNGKSRFVYTKPLDTRNHKPKSEPLIAIPFYFVRNKNFLIIDGNHRISHALDSSKPFLDCFIIHPMRVPLILRGKFEILLYLIFCDMTIIANNFGNKEVLMGQTCLGQYLAT